MKETDTPQLIILKTKPEHLDGVVQEQKHALENTMRQAKRGDLLLIAELQKHGPALVRHGMWFVAQRPAKPGETEALWKGECWPYVIEGHGGREFDTPFRPEKAKISSKNYGQGAITVVYVRPEDAESFRQNGLLRPLLSPCEPN